MAAKKKAASKAGKRCVTFTKTARRGGEKYTPAEQEKHSTCFPLNYKAPPKTAHKGNKKGLYAACFKLSKSKTSKAAKMLAPACAAIGKPIKG